MNLIFTCTIKYYAHAKKVEGKYQWLNTRILLKDFTKHLFLSLSFFCHFCMYIFCRRFDLVLAIYDQLIATMKPDRIAVCIAIDACRKIMVVPEGGQNKQVKQGDLSKALIILDQARDLDLHFDKHVVLSILLLFFSALHFELLCTLYQN